MLHNIVKMITAANQIFMVDSDEIVELSSENKVLETSTFPAL